jgi:hypothetical protein
MSSRLGNLILETCSLPGASAVITLNGPPTGRAAFSSRFAAGSPAYYFLHDGDRWETALGTYGGGSPATLTRPTTVIGNSFGNTSRVDFPGATNVICEAPAQQWVLLDDFALVGTGTNGYIRLPLGIIIQFGFANTVGTGGVANITFPIAFPSVRGPVFAIPVGASVYQPWSMIVGGTFLNRIDIFAGRTTDGVALSGITFYWAAIGW